MATVKIRFRASANPGNAGTLYYQLIHNRVVRQISTDYRLYPDEWDTAGSRIVMPAGCDDSRKRYLSSVHEGLIVYDNLKRGQIIIKKGATAEVAKLTK